MRKALDNPNLDPDRKVKYQARSALHLAAGYGQYSVAEELLFVRSHYVISDDFITIYAFSLAALVTLDISYIAVKFRRSSVMHQLKF